MQAFATVNKSNEHSFCSPVTCKKVQLLKKIATPSRHRMRTFKNISLVKRFLFQGNLNV